MGNELSGQDKERTVIGRDQLRELRNRIDNAASRKHL